MLINTRQLAAIAAEPRAATVVFPGKLSTCSTLLLSLVLGTAYWAPARAGNVNYTGTEILQSLPSWFPGTSASLNSLFFGSPAAPSSVGNNIHIQYDPTGGGIVNPTYVLGGLSETGNVSSNRVEIFNGRVSGGVWGGYSKNGNADSNDILIRGGTISSDVAGGRSVDGSASFNTVTVNGGDVDQTVYGGSGLTAANQNTVLFANGRIGGDIFGGYSRDGLVEANYVYMSGGVGAQNVYGAESGTGEVYNNHVMISAGEINAYVYGGNSLSSAYVHGNHVTLHQGDILAKRSVIGGYSNAGDVIDNSAWVHSGTVQQNAIGGQSISGRASENVASVNGGIVESDVYGGWSRTGEVSGNYAQVAGGTVLNSLFAGYNSISGDAIDNHAIVSSGLVKGDVYGGRVVNGRADANTVYISGGMVEGNVIGGWSDAGQASDNLVMVVGGTVLGNVYGAYSNGSALLQNNKVMLSGSPDLTAATVYGNELSSWASDGNLLSVEGFVGSVRGIQGFQTVNIDHASHINVLGRGGYAFHDVSNAGQLSFFNGSADANVATFAGTYSGNGVIGLDVDFSGAAADTINFAHMPAGKVRLAFRPTVGNFATVEGTGIKVASVADGAHDRAFAMADPGYGVYEYEIARNGNDYFLTTSSGATGRLGKVYSEASAARMGQLSMGVDSLLSGGLNSAVSRAGGQGLGSYVSLGYSDNRFDTGSRADVNGVSGMVAVAYNGGSPLSVGVFGEFFRGDYDTRNDATTSAGSFTVRSDGDLRSYGGGVFAQYRPGGAATNMAPWSPGMYLEGSIRAGSSRMEFSSGDFSRSELTSRTHYHGVSVGGGYVFALNERSSVDVYGHGIWTHQGSDTVRDSLGQRISFEDADSFRVVAGARLSHAVSEQTRLFAGLGLDWETDGKPGVRVDGYRADKADLSGVSGTGELGVVMQPRDNTFVELKLKGSAGERDSVGGALNARFQF